VPGGKDSQGDKHAKEADVEMETLAFDNCGASENGQQISTNGQSAGNEGDGPF
jgi:hypothetical protein